MSKSRRPNEGQGRKERARTNLKDERVEVREVPRLGETLKESDEDLEGEGGLRGGKEGGQKKQESQSSGSTSTAACAARSDKAKEGKSREDVLEDAPQRRSKGCLRVGKLLDSSINSQHSSRIPALRPSSLEQ